MSLGSFIIATAMLHIQSTTASSVIPVSRGDGQWVVPVEVDGKKLRMLLDDEHPSAINPSVAKTLGLAMEASHKLTVGRLPLGDAILSNDTPSPGLVPFDGVLGIDVLRGCAIGFDVAKSTVSIWPGGLTESSAAEAWVKAGGVRPGTIGQPGAWQTPILLDPSGVTSVSEKCGGKELLTRLLISWFNPYVPANVLEGTDPFVLEELGNSSKLVFTASLQLGSISPGIAVITGGGPPDEFEPEEGCIGVDYLNSSRVIMDFVNRRMYEQVLDPRSRAAMTWSNSLKLSMYVSGSDLFLGPVDAVNEHVFSRTSARPGDKILHFRGVDASVYVKFFSLGAACTPKDIANFYKAVQGKPYKLSVLHDGKVVEYDLSSFK